MRSGIYDNGLVERRKAGLGSRMVVAGNQQTDSEASDWPRDFWTNFRFNAPFGYGGSPFTSTVQYVSTPYTSLKKCP